MREAGYTAELSTSDETDESTAQGAAQAPAYRELRLKAMVSLVAGSIDRMVVSMLVMSAIAASAHHATGSPDPLMQWSHAWLDPLIAATLPWLYATSPALLQWGLLTLTAGVMGWAGRHFYTRAWSAFRSIAAILLSGNHPFGSPRFTAAMSMTPAISATMIRTESPGASVDGPYENVKKFNRRPVLPSDTWVSARHGEHFAGLQESAAIADRCADLDNLIVACRRAVMRDDVATAAGALENAWAALRLRGPFRVGVELAQRVCAMDALAGSQRAQALRIAGVALDAAGDPGAAHDHLAAALSAARQVADARCEAQVLSKLATLTRNQGRVEEGCAQVVAALALIEGGGDPRLQCDLHNALGSLRLEMGQVDAARIEYETVPASSQIPLCNFTFCVLLHIFSRRFMDLSISKITLS